jgi:hypothetical protein
MGVRAYADFQLFLTPRKQILPMVNQQKRPNSINLRSRERLLNPIAAHQNATGWNKGNALVHG